jgi:hypothetical protein
MWVQKFSDNVYIEIRKNDSKLAPISGAGKRPKMGVGAVVIAKVNEA